jgi:serine/threonine-protein kinase
MESAHSKLGSVEILSSAAEAIAEASIDTPISGAMLMSESQTSSEPHRADQASLRIGKTFGGRYRLDKQLAEGGMGVVYLATQLQLNRKVVVKVLSPRLGSVDQKMAQRFSLEASALARIVHPNIVTVYDYGQTQDGEFFIAMQHIVGRTLESVIDEDGPLDFASLVDIAIQIGRALREAHASRIIHRDLKPRNVMIVDHKDQERSDYVKVLDFGLATLLGVQPTPEEAQLAYGDSLVGSPKYMSPEQILGEKLDQRTDVYAMGVILYQMAAGVAPFTGSAVQEIMNHHLVSQAPPINSVGYRRPCAPSLEAVITCCLSKTRDQRYATMNELLADLKSVYKQIAGPNAPSRPVSVADDSNPGANQQALLAQDLVLKEAIVRARMDSGITAPQRFDSGSFSRGLALSAPPPPYAGPPPYSAPPAGPPPLTAEMPFVGIEHSQIYRAQPRSRAPLLLGGVSIVAAAISAVFLLRPPEPSALTTSIEQPASAERGAKGDIKTTPTEVRVTFNSNPSGAKVTESGVVLGVTPFIREYPINTTERTFLFELQDHQPTSVIAILTGDRMEVRATLNHAEATEVVEKSAPATRRSRVGHVRASALGKKVAQTSRSVDNAAAPTAALIEDKASVPMIDEEKSAAVPMVQ